MPSWSENWISLGLRLVGHWELIVMAAAVTTNEVVQLHLLSSRLARSFLWGPPGGRRTDLFIWSLDRQLPRYTLLTLDNMLGWVAKMLTCVCLFSYRTMSSCYFWNYREFRPSDSLRLKRSFWCRQHVRPIHYLLNIYIYNNFVPSDKFCTWSNWFTSDLLSLVSLASLEFSILRSRCASWQREREND